MDMINRTLRKTIEINQKSGFINLIYGPRRVGKTTLLHQIIDGLDKTVWFNGDTEETREVLSSTNSQKLSTLVKPYDVIVIDEAQRINNIGLSLKILIDLFPDKKFFVTGSSSLSLARGLKEPLTGRHISYRLYPLSTIEMYGNIERYKWTSQIIEQLTYGGYPNLLDLPTPDAKKKYLSDLIDSYLFQDIFNLATLQQPDLIKKLSILLAHQVGSLVSYNELATTLQVDVKTIMRYLSLLEQSFIIFTLPSYSSNLRKELVKSKKYYFWDLGIRNILAGQIDHVELPSIKGQLWENFLCLERLKKLQYENKLITPYFWRTHEQVEVDWLELDGNKISAYEFKLHATKYTTPKSFKDTYNQEVRLISTDNYLDFIT